MSVISDVYPVLGLRITAGSLELRGLTDGDLAALGVLAQGGVHPPERMPFYHPWTDMPVEQIPLGMAQYHWGVRARFSPAAWSLELGVWVDGELVGCQGFGTSDYLVTRTGETGSWLGIEHQGSGIGTRMRQAMCAFVFDHLDADEVTSGAFLDNPASIAVSHKVGYADNGISRKKRRDGEMAEHLALRLTPETFVRGEPIEVEGAAAVRRLIGL
ncbi:GNAT family N-acetyltransferase [Pseudactinotalea terrae]|uniref:GNAT family N-acetyltransferase n=1 Tax=Pseudactinotalea terrae TaxID=1743262 RepID=UPI001478DFF0|nr:GNAT family protein [Pseudactinotalea terrae]